MITATDVKALQERTGCGVTQCRKALEVCEENKDLAFFYLRYVGCAIVTYPLTNEEWALKRAKEEYLKI